MLHTSKPVAWLAIVLIGFIGITGIGWQKNPTGKTATQQSDTIPERKHRTVIDGDLDRAIEELNRAKENLERQLNKRDWEKVQHHLSESMEKINLQQIREQIERSMKAVDMQKMQLQVQEAMKGIKWEKMQAEIEKAQGAFDNTDRVRMKREMQRAMELAKESMGRVNEIDMKEMHRAMERARENMRMQGGRLRADMDIARENIREHMGKDFRKELEKARENVNRAGEELKQYKEMVTEMDKDGLLKIKEPYSIEYKEGELMINGAKQPASVIEKYKHYFRHENIKIKKSGDKDSRTIYL